ncbi:MAG TPA: hypothetical protein IAC20_00390 [Candidatus Faecisoma merdavium]|nr:hypothetical protein [Candidatus Faecisoma merdavium]
MQYINKNPKIFILSGKAGSGKNYVADIISDYYKNSIQISYAYYLKQYVKKISNWDGLEETKPRTLLQSLGIDLIKKIDKELLIRRVMEDIKVYSYFFDVIIVTDARLKEEIIIPKNLFDCITIRINGKDNDLTLEQKNHITETDLDNYKFDYVINNVDINKTKEEVLKLLGGIDELN